MHNFNIIKKYINKDSSIYNFYHILKLMNFNSINNKLKPYKYWALVDKLDLSSSASMISSNLYDLAITKEGLVLLGKKFKDIIKHYHILGNTYFSYNGDVIFIPKNHIKYIYIKNYKIWIQLSVKTDKINLILTILSLNIKKLSNIPKLFNK